MEKQELKQEIIKPLWLELLKKNIVNEEQLIKICKVGIKKLYARLFFDRQLSKWTADIWDFLNHIVLLQGCQTTETLAHHTKTPSFGND